jgi:hypothetical protein
MLKRIALVSVIGVAFMVPALAAQAGEPPVASGARHRARPLKSHMRQIVRDSRLTGDQLKQLSKDIAAFRQEKKALRQAGKPLADEARKQLQASRQKLRQEIRSLAGKPSGRKARKGTKAGGTTTT